MSRRISNRRLPTKQKVLSVLPAKPHTEFPIKSQTKRFGAPHGAPFLFDKLIKIRKKACQSTKNMLQSFSLKKASDRGVVQLVESRSPKPLVLGSSPSAPAKTPARKCGSFAFDRGRGLEPCFPVGNGFSDGKNEANRLVLGVKPRTTLKAVFGRIARNTPPGCFGACLPSVPCKKYGNVCFRTILFRRPASGRRNLHFGLVFFRYL